ncbi:aldo/keto reductase [Candidatus Woesearchaeota archaeon]|nr:aldo/keto reductase [Candidatus Woesearchaeota archaeon]
MEYKKLQGGLKIPVLGIGSWLVGGGFIKDTSKDKEAINSIKKAIGLGISHIDTAEVYGEGHAEELIGQAITDLPRKDIILTSKVWRDNLSYKGIIEAAKNSLQRLRTDYIDLYLIHWPNPLFPLSESIKAMNDLVDQKIVRCIGVSNFTVDQMEEAVMHSKHPIVANQIEYNLLHREPEEEVIPYCHKNNIAIIAYKPIARGSLAFSYPGIVDELAAKYSKTPVQVALNWLISQKGVITIPKAVNEDHIMENLGSIGWKLSEEDIKRINLETD